MTKSLTYSLAVAFLVVLLFNPASAVDDKSVALSLKAKGDVQHKKAGSDDAKLLKVGTRLDDGDNIRTGAEAFAVLIFTDDKSMIKLAELTEVVIEGKRDAQSNITKRISMEVGNLYANVQQQRGTLQIATPTSVASVKGTQFWVVVLADGTTYVVTLDGLVELRNRLSGQIVEVRPGQIGQSSPDGEVGSREVLPEDIPNDPDPNIDNTETIQIELRDSEGRSKDVNIEVRTE